MRIDRGVLTTQRSLEARLLDRATDPISSGVTIGTNGRLPTAVLARFISTGVDQSAPLPDVDTVPMDTDKMRMDTLSLATRMLRAPGEGVGTTDKQVVTAGGRLLDVVETVLSYRVTYSFLEDNIMREGGAQFVLDEFALAFFNDQADLFINGDTAAVDADPGIQAFLRLNEGLIKLAKAASGTGKADITAAMVAAGDYDGAIFPALLAALPVKYRAKKTEFKIWCSVNAAEGWMKQCRARGTPEGDRALTDGRLLPWNGMEIKPLPQMPDGVFLVLRPKNGKFGIRREMTIETEKKTEERMYAVTVSGRTDAQIAVEPEVVVGYDITP